VGKAVVNAFTGKDSNTNQPSGPKAKDAPGETAGEQATNEHGQKLGPSGKPQVNNVDKNTREAARNAANKGSGVIEHRNPTRGGPHFHPKRGDRSKKRDGSHSSGISTINYEINRDASAATSP